jgi:hypothetical protein
MFAGAGAIGVEALDDEIERSRADEVEVAIDPGGGAHLIGSAIEVG